MQTETLEFGFPFSANKAEHCAWNSIVIQVTQDPQKGRALADEQVTNNVSTAVKNLEVDAFALIRPLIDRVISAITFLVWPCLKPMPHSAPVISSRLSINYDKK